jgi:hypothetical protein
MNLKPVLFVVLLVVIAVNVHGAALTFNSPDFASAAAIRAAWLTASGAGPVTLVDFESGFVNGQNISGVGGLFPGLVITDTSAAGAVIIRTGAGVINGSNTIGSFSATQNELPFLLLDFSASPADFFGFRDIDQAGTAGTVYFVGGGSQAISLETTAASGDSAEFFGVFRNDMPRILRVELDASGDGLWGIDNIEYGQFPSRPRWPFWLLAA